MTQARSRIAVLFAALALVIGCALVVTTPQTAQADDLKLGRTVGGTTAAATNMPLVGKSLSTTAFAEFNDNNDNHFYKFTTSDRNSTYRLNLRADSNDGAIYFTIYDSSMHRFYTSATNGSFRANRTITLQKLRHNSVYYVEVWRLAVNTPWYVINNDDDQMSSNVYVPNAAYRLTITERITRPAAVTNLRATSPSKKKLKVKWDASHYADAYQLLIRNSVDKNSKNYYFKTSRTTYTLKTKYSGKYRVWVRPYRKVNGKTYYGAWSPSTNTAWKYGLKVTVKAS